jgi:hypothetical protein
MDLFKLKTQLITIPIPLPSTLLVTHSRKDKINTTPESNGGTNPKINLMPGEPFHISIKFSGATIQKVSSMKTNTSMLKLAKNIGSVGLLFTIQ